jgi:hypothetical protein
MRIGVEVEGGAVEERNVVGRVPPLGAGSSSPRLSFAVLVTFATLSERPIWCLIGGRLLGDACLRLGEAAMAFW